MHKNSVQNLKSHTLMKAAQPQSVRKLKLSFSPIMEEVFFYIWRDGRENSLDFHIL